MAASANSTLTCYIAFIFPPVNFPGLWYNHFEGGRSYVRGGRGRKEIARRKWCAGVARGSSCFYNITVCSLLVYFSFSLASPLRTSSGLLPAATAVRAGRSSLFASASPCGESAAVFNLATTTPIYSALCPPASSGSPSGPSELSGFTKIFNCAGLFSVKSTRFLGCLP